MIFNFVRNADGDVDVRFEALQEGDTLLVRFDGNDMLDYYLLAIEEPGVDPCNTEEMFEFICTKSAQRRWKWI